VQGGKSRRNILAICTGAPDDAWQHTQKPSAPPSRAPIAMAGEIHRQSLINGVPGDEEMPGCKRNPHSATAGYPARSSKMLDFDGKSAGMGMTSCLITVISPSDTVGHIASYGIPNATMRRFRNRSQNGAERRQPRWRLIEYSPILLVRLVS
jgi:hypothetical protein